MRFLWNGHRDAAKGRHFCGMGGRGPNDDRKQSYGHAVVLTATSSAKILGHCDACRLLADVSAARRARLCEKAHGAVAEEFSRDWKPNNRHHGQEPHHASDRSPHGGIDRASRGASSGQPEK